MTQEPDVGWEGGVAPQVTRIKGLWLPGLKQWRIRRGISQQELATRVGARLQYISRVEQRKMSCKRSVAQRIAEVLEVDLEDLRAGPAAGALNVHKSYLKMLLGRVIGSAYSAMGEEELEKYCKGLSWEEVLEVVEARKRELAFVREELLEREEDMHPQVRAFLEDVVHTYPDRDLRLLAAMRNREDSEEGRGQLTRAMREFL
jgi:transcriptional regulator with XRE-family HTH domain